MGDEIVAKRPNRKRKKSFLKNARKYAKKGYYGRGSQLETDVYQYFIRIMETYREGFDSEEDKIVFVNNVFDQTIDQEVNCSCNQVGCRVVEILLPFANDVVLKRFMNAFSSDLRPLCKDRFASHVLEALVTTSCKQSINTNEYKEFVLKISKFLLNNLEDYVWDTYGNHVIRTCLENLAQIPKGETKDNKSINESEENISEEYVDIIKEYGERLIVWPQFNELCHLELTSGFLQILLKCLQKVDRKLLKKYLKKLLGETFKSNQEENQPNSLPEAFLSRPVLMLLESAIENAPPKIFLQIYSNLFKDKLPKLAKTRSTNFAVQKLFQHCKEKTIFETMFDEIADHFEEIIQVGHTGVILSIAQTCKRLSTKQGSFVQNLMKSFHCFEPEERQNKFVLCLSRLKAYEESEKIIDGNLQKEKLNLHGTLILQVLLDYNKPIKIVNGILSLDNNELKQLFSNSMGSHIIDSYVRGLFVGEKSREKLIKKMFGTYQELASLKYGSRSFEALWNVASLKAKIKIMEELAIKDGAWCNSEHGKIIAGKINLVLFKRNQENWKHSLNKVDKSEKFLADILK